MNREQSPEEGEGDPLVPLNSERLPGGDRINQNDKPTNGEPQPPQSQGAGVIKACLGGDRVASPHRGKYQRQRTGPSSKWPTGVLSC